jgi:hypothetical protein
MSLLTPATRDRTGPHTPLIEWAFIEPNRRLMMRTSSGAYDDRTDVGRPVWQYDLEADMATLVDPTQTLAAHHGGYDWEQTPHHGVVMIAAPGRHDPTARPRNPLAECMLYIATGRRVKVVGSVAWLGGYDYGMHFYLTFSSERLESLNQLQAKALARLGNGAA